MGFGAGRRLRRRLWLAWSCRFHGGSDNRPVVVELGCACGTDGLGAGSGTAWAAAAETERQANNAVKASL